MREPKLHQLLATMDAHELNRLSRYMASPYHCEDIRLRRFYAYLLPHYKAARPELPDRKKAWRAAHGAKAFSDIQYARLLSDMLKKAESFIAIETMRGEGADESYYMLQYYNKRGLTANFTDPYELALRRLQQYPYRDRDYYFHSFRLHAQHNTFLENKKLRTPEKNLKETIESLDMYYFISKLRYSAAVLHYRQFLGVDEELALLSDILRYLRGRPPVPVVALYQHIILTLTEPADAAHYTQLKAVLFGQSKALQQDSQREGFAFALNYCIRRINAGDTTWQLELFTLYKEALKHGLMYDQGLLNPWDFKNIVTVALRVKEYKWTATFIERSLVKLRKGEQQNAYSFNMARYYFATGKYDKVLQLLQDVAYTDIFYLLDAKVTLMKTYYELGEYEPLLSLKESFRILLRRKKIISDQHRVNYGNFARLTMKLYRADVKNKVQMAALKKAIDETTNVADRAWILEQYGQLVG
ncbi:MAG: hypothetical protein JST90_19550 [Bacteroidetes bacterium]|nr:hypothetical protein [Bacteroidota bacterium]